MVCRQKCRTVQTSFAYNGPPPAFSCAETSYHRLPQFELPQLHICQESPPLAHLVVIIKLVDLLDAQSPPSGLEVCNLRVPPWGSEDQFVANREKHNDQHTNHVLEEVVSRESSTTLRENISICFLHLEQEDSPLD